MTAPEDAVLLCVETALARLLALADDIRFGDHPHPWHPTYLVWDRIDGQPENYRCVTILPRPGATYSAWIERRRHELAARWLATSHPAEALAVTASEAPTVIAGHATTIMVMRARYTCRGIAPEGLTTEVPYTATAPIGDEFEVVWLNYPKGESLYARTLAQAVRRLPRALSAPTEGSLTEACLQTWYEDPI